MEEKKYSIIGKVEIGTDEYRDLIEAVKDAQKMYDSTNTDRWKEYSRANKAEEQLKTLREENDKMTNFINSSGELQVKYFQFSVDQAIKNTNNE